MHKNKSHAHNPNMPMPSTVQLQQTNIRMPGRNQIAHAEVNGTGESAKVLNYVTERKTKTYGHRGISASKIVVV
jgi:hypothetical protein